MKKIVLAFSLFLFCSSVGFSQLGIRGGLNMSNVSISTDGFTISPSSKIGFHAGITYDANIGTNLTLRPGLLYSTQGYEIEGFGSVSTNYINIPINFVKEFGGEAESGFFIQGGPYLGLLMTAKSDGEDIKDDYKSLDLGIGLGVGYNINSNISVGLDYALGIANVANDTSGESTARNTNIMLYFLYRI